MLMSVALVIGNAAERREVNTTNTSERNTVEQRAQQHNTEEQPESSTEQDNEYRGEA